jgi:photosystem II stability/assembly factor-like uncharacterized protein
MFALLLLVASAGGAQAHDPGAWGGVFRSRDHGATWVSANRGPYLSGAVALAISPTDSDHLLLGTESGLLRSRNGGRDWTIEAPAVVLGAVFALAFAADGRRAMASTGQGLLRSGADGEWSAAPTPGGAAPARAILRGAEDGRVYLAGRSGVYRSDDWGASWANAAAPAREPATALVVVPGPPETLHAAARDGIRSSADGGRSWAVRAAGIPLDGIEALAADALDPARLWAADGAGLSRSDDNGGHWRRIGRPLPEPSTAVNGIAAGAEAIVLTTDRGLYRSVDGGESWTLPADGLPAHLEAGPLLRDPGDPATLYAGFALTPSRELWRRAAENRGALAQVSAASLAGSMFLLLLVAFGAVAALRRLRRFYPHTEPAAAPARKVLRREIGEETLL